MDTPTTPALGTPENPSPEQCQEIFRAKATLAKKDAAPADRDAARKVLQAAHLAGGKLKVFAFSGGQTLGSVTFTGFTYGLLDIEGPAAECEPLDTTNMSTEASTDGGFNKTHIPSAYVKGGAVTLTVQDDPATVAPVGQQDSLTIVSGPSGTSQSGTASLLKYTPHKPLEGKVMTATAVFEISGAFA